VVTEPVGLQDVPAGDEAAFLAPLPAELLHGVGPKMQEQLLELNIRIIRELGAMRLEHLMLAFGRLGFMLHQRALGIDDTPVYPSRTIPAVEEETALAEDSNDWDLLKGALCRLCERAGERLREQKQRAGRMEVLVRYSDYREAMGRAKLVPPLQSSALLAARAGCLLERTLTRRTRVRSLHLRLAELSSGPAQLDLFADPKPLRQARLESALDTLRRQVIRNSRFEIASRISNFEFRISNQTSRPLWVQPKAALD
jgi:DNA polymerase-4